jgi:asparagine N-glycosylation enzyme membrane subunit Stt3
LALSSNLRENKPYFLPLLLIISFVSYFPFVLNGFGELDATRIAVSVIDMIEHGSNAAFSNYYFTDVIPLYILYLKLFMKLLNYDYSLLPIVMNYTNAVFGTLTVIPAFLLIKRLFGNPTIAFCAVLALIFAPAFYQVSIAGFPHLLAFFFLLMSLNFYLSGLDHNRKSIICFWMILATLSLTLAFLFKSDYVLGIGAFIGFLFIRKINNKWKIFSTFLIIIMSGVLFLLLRHLIMGSSSGATNSISGFAEWRNIFWAGVNSLSSLPHLKRQIKPIIYATGFLTFFLGIISFIYLFTVIMPDIICSPFFLI